MEASEGFGMSGALLVIILTLWTVAEGADKWSDDAVYYRLDVDSFKDDDGDGLGDLTGATQKITYVKALGADAVVLSVLAVHSRECSRPGILDLANIDDRYGSMAQLGDLLSKARKIDLKMLITFPTQTISVASEWFLSSANKTPGFEDWVYWREGVEDQEPSAGQGFAWKWHEERNAWWGVKDDQAMLNLCSSGVSTALSTALCAWIRRGLSGVVIGLDYLIEPNCGQKLLRQMVSSASDCARASSMDLPVILIESSLGIDKAIDLYGEENGAVTARLASNALTLIPKPTTPELALRLYAGLMYSSEKVRPVWLTSDIKSTRIASRYGAEMIDTVNLLALMLPGSVMLQQGDELGAPDVPSEWLPSTPDKCWPNHRPRPSAAPFPWDDSTHGGFSSNEPWVPLAPNFRYFNAKAQFASDSSHVSMVRVATAMRRSPAMGPHVDIFRLGNAVAVLRWGSIGTLLVVCNPTTAGTAVQLSRIPGLAREVTVAVSSAGSSLLPETHLRVDRVIELAPGEVILLAGPPRHCGGPGPVDKIANKLSEGWQILNKYFNSA